MLSNIIEVGDKIDIYEKKSRMVEQEVTEPRRIYKSKIYDITSETVIRIAMPIEAGKVILLPVDGRYTLDFYTNGGIYQARGKIIERYKENNIYVLVIELITKLEKNQRREYYRFNCSIELEYELINENESILETLSEIEALRQESIIWSEGFIADLSGGGMRFITDVSFDRNTYCICKFKLLIKHSIKEFVVKGKVLTSDKLLNREKKYENRMHFINNTKEDTEDIIRFIFEEERKSRKNGKS